MANLMDICEALSQEGKLSQKYAGFQKEIKDKSGKARMEQLIELSKKQMDILLQIIKEGNWVTK